MRDLIYFEKGGKGLVFGCFPEIDNSSPVMILQGSEVISIENMPEGPC